jgi:phage terminase large subunit-like protein
VPDGAGPDWQVPRDEVADVLERMIGGYNVLEVACDPWGWRSEMQEWSERYSGQLVVEFATNSRAHMGPACDRFRADVQAGTLTHDGDATLARHVGHCVAKVTAHGTTVTKAHPDSRRKIDVAVAAVVAYERAAWHAAHYNQGPLVAWA